VSLGLHSVFFVTGTMFAACAGLAMGDVALGIE
jgi:hypothetical protein